MAARKSPLVVIVGETASGKSALAMELAEKFDGEIICADSRTVYKGMNIGTAKPSVADQQNVTHHLLDIVEPDENLNVRQFQQLAIQAIEDIARHGRLPILVGGAGLYVDSVLFDYEFSPPGARRDIENPRHLKYQDMTAYKSGLRHNTLVLGLQRTHESLKVRIEQRIEAMISLGLEQEVRNLVKRYGWEAPGLNTIGYREFRGYFDGKKSLDEVVEGLERNTILYAKRQRTWFKRNESIHWLNDPSGAVDLVTTFLNKKA